MEYANEVWKVLVGINENHAISNYGRKKYLKTGCIINGMETNGKRKDKKVDKYLYFDINNKKYYAHRLVAIYFIPNNDKSKNHVNHIDGNTLNPHVNNLEWCSARENLHYRFRKNRNSIKSKYIGVNFKDNIKNGKKWYAQISINKRTQCLGYYYTEIEAYEAYKAKSLEIGRETLEIK